jgi:LysM repeat protein
MHRKMILVLCVLALSLALIGPAYASPQHYGLPTWHLVSRGETLFSIGRLYGVSPWDIAAANSLANPDKIYAGTYLYIPAVPYQQWSGTVHYVQIGETLHAIGRMYNVSPWSIAAANGIYNLNYIYAGQWLYIP